jgi:hypothetical protein
MTLNTVNEWFGFTYLEVSFLLIETVTTTGTPHGARSRELILRFHPHISIPAVNGSRRPTRELLQLPKLAGHA